MDLNGEWWYTGSIWLQPLNKNSLLSCICNGHWKATPLPKELSKNYQSLSHLQQAKRLQGIGIIIHFAIRTYAKQQRNGNPNMKMYNVIKDIISSRGM